MEGQFNDYILVSDFLETHKGFNFSIFIWWDNSLVHTYQELQDDEH